jgi:hypothetical protein
MKIIWTLALLTFAFAHGERNTLPTSDTADRTLTAKVAAAIETQNARNIIANVRAAIEAQNVTAGRRRQ